MVGIGSTISLALHGHRIAYSEHKCRRLVVPHIHRCILLRPLDRHDVLARSIRTDAIRHLGTVFFKSEIVRNNILRDFRFSLYIHVFNAFRRGHAQPLFSLLSDMLRRKYYGDRTVVDIHLIGNTRRLVLLPSPVILYNTFCNRNYFYAVVLSFFSSYNVTPCNDTECLLAQSRRHPNRTTRYHQHQGYRIGIVVPIIEKAEISYVALINLNLGFFCRYNLVK